MASRLFKQFLFSLNPMLTYIEGSFSIGATGAVSAVKGGGISNVVRLSAGCYQVKLEDSYNRLLMTDYSFVSPVTGSDINISGSSVMTIGQVYRITAVGTSTTANWVAVGLPVGVVPAVGVAFAASVTGSGTGTGTVKAIGVSGCAQVEVMGDANLSIGQPTNPYIILQCLSATSSSVTTMIAADPASGSIMKMHFFFRNSSLKGKGE